MKYGFEICQHPKQDLYYIKKNGRAYTHAYGSLKTRNVSLKQAEVTVQQLINSIDHVLARKANG